MIFSALLVGLGLASHASAACTRATLQAAADAYGTSHFHSPARPHFSIRYWNILQKLISRSVKAQGAGTALTGLATSNFTYFENDVALDITKGVLSQAITIDLSRSLIDTNQCATFTEISAATNKKPYVIHTRMIFSSDGSQITSIQSVVAKDGDWAFNAAGQLKCRCFVLFLSLPIFTLIP